MTGVYLGMLPSTGSSSLKLGLNIVSMEIGTHLMVLERHCILPPVWWNCSHGWYQAEDNQLLRRDQPADSYTWAWPQPGTVSLWCQAILATFYKGYKSNLNLDMENIQAIQSLYGQHISKPTPKPNPSPVTTNELCQDKYQNLTRRSLVDGYPRNIEDDCPELHHCLPI